MFNFLTFLIILILTYKTRANNFIVEPNEKSFFEPCENTDDGGNINVSDLAVFNLSHDYADDMETLITNGNITINADLPDDTPIQLDLEILEWKRGKWEQTIYSIKRTDVCKVLFDPTELWYELTTQLPEEDRVCPPKKGMVYHIKDVENRIKLSHIMGLDLEGQYKAIMHFIAGEYSTCITSIANVWKD